MRKFLNSICIRTFVNNHKCYMYTVNVVCRKTRVTMITPQKNEMSERNQTDDW